MAYDATKPDATERISKMATDTRANFAAILDGTAWATTGFNILASTIAGGFTRTIADSTASANGAVQFGVKSGVFVAESGAQLLSYIMNNSSVKTYIGRLSFALTDATGSAEKSKFFFSVKNGAGDPTATTNVFGGDAIGSWFGPNTRDGSDSPRTQFQPNGFNAARFGAYSAEAINIIPYVSAPTYMGQVTFNSYQNSSGLWFRIATGGSGMFRFEANNSRFVFFVSDSAAAGAIASWIEIMRMKAIAPQIEFLHDTYRSGSEVGQIAIVFTSAANGNVNGRYERFRHQRSSTPTVTLSATAAGIGDLLVSSVTANSITVNGFYCYLTASGSGTSQAGRTYTTSA